MTTERTYDCIVVGSGPNGLAAAITLQAHGLQTLVMEKNAQIGGGVRSDSPLREGFIHDVCSAVHPMGIASPFFRELQLERFGLEWVYPTLQCAQPIEGESSVALYRSVDETVDQFSAQGAKRYRRLVEPMLRHFDDLFADALMPVLRVPSHPLVLAKLGLRAAWPASAMAKYLEDGRAAALFSGMSGHAVMSFDKVLSSAIGVMLSVAGHKCGWPFAKGGSGSIALAMVKVFRDLGGRVETSREITDLRELPETATIFADTAPRNLVKIGAGLLPEFYKARLMRFRHGPAAFKIDYILSNPIPWKSKQCREAGTVHVGGSFAEVRAAEEDAWRGRVPREPFMLVAQQSLFDRSRVVGNKEIAWAYCHIPHGSSVDMVDAMEARIEVFAPGFRDSVEERLVTTPQAFEQRNPNLVGGDVVGGVADLWQVIGRPLLRLDPYRTPNERVFLCSASTPPGAGVHGMCGFSAARSFLKGRGIKMENLGSLIPTTN